MEPLLCLGSDEVRMIGIWGPPGIGKTTIARVAYNQLSNSFQLSVFMDDIKANSSRLCSDDYSREFLYDCREICELLTGDATGSKSVIGIKLDYYKIEEELYVSEKAFDGMSNLQFLQVNGYGAPLQLTRGLNYLSHKLRLLHWSHFPMSCFPCNVNLEFLVELIMIGSKLEKLWEGIKPLRSLKWMDLSDSVNLKELPNLSTATNLEKLYLRNCWSLIKLPCLPGKSMEELDIGGCSSLVQFPSFTGNAVNLLKLNLVSFPNLVELPSYVGNATNLENLNLSNCSHLVELPLSFGNLQKLQTLILKGCSKLENFPNNITLEFLNDLDLAGCSTLDLSGFSTIVNVVNLQTLNLSSLPQLLEVPSFVGNATNLEDLILSNCSNLVELPLFIGNLQKLKRLRLEGCSKLEILPTNINLESLFELNLNDCSMLKCFPEISTNIRNLYLIGTAIEQVPPSISSWSHLDELKMSYFENLKEFPHALERITCMCLTDTEIQELPPWVKKISRLSVFVLKGCRKLVTLPAISESIRYMDASDCKSLEILECSFHNPQAWLHLANCFKLNQEARNLIIQNSCRYAVLPGGQVPPHFTHRATGGGPLTIKLNEKPLPKYMIFKACILLVYKVDHDACSEVNSMEVDVIYQNSNKKLYPALAEHLYIFRVEAEVTSSELFFEFKLKRDDVWKIGECGLVRDVECISLCFYSTIYICTWNSNVAEEINVTHVLTDITIEEPDPRGSAEMKRMFVRAMCTFLDNEADMIKKIATDTSNMLNNFTPSNDFDGLVGMGAHWENLKSILCLGSDEVRMIGIWGPPGIGKTTIARVAFNQLSNSFQLSVFMDDLKANSSRLCSDDYSGSKSVIGIKFEYYRIREEIDISEKAFEGMSNLQFLKVCGFTDALQITGGLNYLSHKLRLLEWRHFPMTCLPCTVNLEFLVELVMPYSKLEKLWEGCKPLRCLKWMDLGYSVNLKELPDLSTATNLEKLYLYDCSSLVKLPSMSGNSLEKLNIGGCSSLVEFPSFIGNAVNLQELDLSSFPNLLELPSYVGNATNLEYLDLRNCLNMVELPLSLGNLKKLKRLRLKGCSKLEVLPTNINLEYLNELDIAGCSSLDLGDFSTIGNLRELNISSLPQLLEVPSFIGNATNLENLVLSSCSKLVELPLFIGNLQKLRWLRLEGCIRLEVLPTNINLESLLELNLSDCSMLKSFPQISTNLEKLNLRGTAIEQVPPSIRSWPHLKELHMSYFENLKEFPHALERITSLSLTDTEIQEVPPLVKQISRLNRFFLSGCRKLVRLPPISESTHSIYANDCDSLEILECSFSDQIRRLTFANCFKLNQEARDLIIQASSEHAVLPGGQVPEYFTHRATGGGPLTIKLNQNPLPESMTFKACILLLNKGDHEACSKEKSRGVDVVNNNIIFGLYPALAEHLYTFRINLEVTSRKLLFEFKLMSDDDDWKIGECGIVQQ
ncbi:hypothetical protein HID58_008478 [Brassica napus]|uniref:Disease resistance protein n=1 Tax=Brassica napus TaxID=3708 RepID=A0ABQ8DPT9_BRANA|nr:hypothetical protein HID58_008478 [Brassica napus]